MWFSSGKLHLLSPEQNLGAAEWKPFQTAWTSHTTEILILFRSFNEQQKAKEWDKLGVPDHSPQHIWQPWRDPVHTPGSLTLQISPGLANKPAESLFPFTGNCALSIYKQMFWCCWIISSFKYPSESGKVVMNVRDKTTWAKGEWRAQPRASGMLKSLTADDFTTSSVFKPL